MRASQGPREEPTKAYAVLYVRIGDDRERSEATHIGATSCLHHPPAHKRQLFEFLKDQFLEQESHKANDRNTR